VYPAERPEDAYSSNSLYELASYTHTRPDWPVSLLVTCSVKITGAFRRSWPPQIAGRNPFNAPFPFVSGFAPPLSSWAACVMIDLRDCRRSRRSLRVSDRKWWRSGLLVLRLGVAIQTDTERASGKQVPAGMSGGCRTGMPSGGILGKGWWVDWKEGEREGFHMPWCRLLTAVGCC
jgi:hypothetical protein